jgi:uncharacterized membrane protein
MWLPTPVYERIPQFWFLLGLLFISIGLYLGIDFVITLGYIAVGFICCAYGIGIALIRMRYRKNKTESNEPLSSTE